MKILDFQWLDKLELFSFYEVFSEERHNEEELLNLELIAVYRKKKFVVKINIESFLWLLPAAAVPTEIYDDTMTA